MLWYGASTKKQAVKVSDQPVDTLKFSMSMKDEYILRKKGKEKPGMSVVYSSFIYSKWLNFAHKFPMSTFISAALKWPKSQLFLLVELPIV